MSQPGNEKTSPFPHPWIDAFFDGERSKCLDDWLIADICNQIRQKPEWEQKFQNPEIVAKWKAELEAQNLKTHHFNEVFDYVLNELQWYKNKEESLLESGFKFAFDPLVLHSDKAISEKTKSSFKENEKALEAAIEKDYHPNSKNLVVDVVHPSLYPVVYGKTQELDDQQLKTVEYSSEIEKAKKIYLKHGVSEKYQWLPALMTLNKDSNSFEFVSYINNLHPIQFEDLYSDIAQIFNASLPGLNLSLSIFSGSFYKRVTVPDGHEAYAKEFYDIQDKLYDYESPEDGELDYDDIEKQLNEKRRELIKKCPPVWNNGPQYENLDLTAFDDLKVIVKLANIELTPENPRYEGGSWHVEGTINEDIVATILYYYDIENIEDSNLAFRESVHDPYYEQGDEYYCEYFYGIKDGDIMRKLSGSVSCKEDRVVIFPNIYQHHVDAFELADKTKPGHRKILCFFVVDPFNKLVKTSATVPPQQEEWVKDEKLMKYYFPDLKTLPPTMTYAEALDVREKLMAERSAKATEEEADEESAFYRTFSLCEH